MTLSIHKRWEIVFLVKHEKGPKYNYSKASKYLDISRNTVKKWIKRYGDVQDLEGRERKKERLCPVLMTNLFDFFEEDDNNDLSSSSINYEEKKSEIIYSNNFQKIT
jgi:transposase